MDAEFVLAITSGVLAAISLALWLRLKRISRKQDEIFDLFKDTVTKGIKVEVLLELDGSSAGNRKAQNRKSVRNIVSRGAMLKAVSSTRATALPRYTHLEEAKVAVSGHEVIDGEVVYVLTLTSKKGSSTVKRKVSALQTLSREISVAWEDEKKSSLQPLPAAPVNFAADPADEAAIEKTKAVLGSYFSAMPDDALSLVVVQRFFEPEQERAKGGEESRDLEFDGEEEIEDEEVFEIPEGLTAVNVKMDSAVQYIEGYAYLDTSKKIAALSQGKTFFTFAFHSGTTLTERQILHVDAIVNLSSFEDEMRDNDMPPIDIKDPDTAAQYTVAIVKNGYILPDTTLDDFTPELLCSQEYLHACMPGPPKIWKEVPDDTTFRITKTIIPWVFNMTIQFKCSTVPESKLGPLGKIDNCPVHKAILMERTKRDRTVQDATRKAKSILLYTQLEGGVLVRNLTIVLNSWVPSFVVPFIDSAGALGSKETKETAVMARKYFKNKKKGKK